MQPVYKNMRKSILFLIFFIFWGAFYAFSDGVANQGLYKKGKFHKDHGFNKEDNRDMLPPDPGGDDPFPIPVGKDGLVLSAGFILFLTIRHFRKKTVNTNNNAI